MKDSTELIEGEASGDAVPEAKHPPAEEVPDPDEDDLDELDGKGHWYQ